MINTLTISYDRNWRKLWEKRFEYPLTDAESFKIDADVLIDSEYFNNLDYQLYDHILFTNNQNDSGNFLIKTRILQELNGFNEYILRGYNDHDLISRILKRNPNLKRTTVYDKIHKLEHKNELRVEASRPALLLNNEDFYYGIVKGYNEQSPFNAIIIEGAIQEVPLNITDQLDEEGRLLAIIQEEEICSAKLFKKNV